MVRVRQLTELEGCVLGLIRQRGSCTPYTIRRVFLKSPTPHWSGSADGETAVARWLGPPFYRLIIGVPPDPLRTRIGFLGLLAPSERRAFLKEAATGLQSHLAEFTSALATEADPFERLALRGSQLAMQARVAWLGELVKALGSCTADKL